MFNKTSNFESIKKGLESIFHPYFELFSDSEIVTIINFILKNKIFEPYALEDYLREELIKKVGIRSFKEIEDRLKIGF